MSEIMTYPISDAVTLKSFTDKKRYTAVAGGPGHSGVSGLHGIGS